MPFSDFLWTKLDTLNRSFSGIPTGEGLTNCLWGVASILVPVVRFLRRCISLADVNWVQEPADSVDNRTQFFECPWSHCVKVLSPK